MPAYEWIIIIVAIVAFLLGLGGTIIAFGIIKPKRRSLLETSVLEEEKFPGIMEFYAKTKTAEYQIRSRYGYELCIYYLKNPKPSKRFLVMSHGHTYTHHGCLKYAKMMMDHGFNIILSDQRFHGNSGGNYTSLGWYEKDDLYDIITDTINRYGEDIEIGTYGESMGSATVLLEAQNDSRVQYIFSDCGFSNFDTLLKEIFAKKIKVPMRYLLPVGKLAFRLFTKIKINRISPIDALNHISVPIFFAHGLQDDFIPYAHSEAMYESYRKKKMIYLGGNDARHAGCYQKNQVEYEQKIFEFVSKFIVKNDKNISDK
ncbi:MAG: alpha/beta hydrolase [Bacilli bacterium]|nr:alpha/beta hydrolase [Bacilli bacterium]